MSKPIVVEGMVYGRPARTTFDSTFFPGYNPETVAGDVLKIDLPYKKGLTQFLRRKSAEEDFGAQQGSEFYFVRDADDLEPYKPVMKPKEQKKSVLTTLAAAFSL